VIRIATAGDRLSLQRLAELDSATPPTGATLIAELRGSAVAALSLNDGSTIADPFVPTSELVELLRVRAKQLRPRLAPRASFVMPRLTRTPPMRSLRLLLR
jgi:hypothetical protein